jgi:hypothetical protein
MKTFTRWLLVVLLVAVPLMAVIQTASANTEMVPASRLVAPLVDISTNRSTHLLISNVAVNAPILQNGVAGTVGGVHIEYYDKNCARTSQVIQLSPKDIDQIDVTSTFFPSAEKVGFADIDVRNTTVYTDPLLASSIRENTLVGQVLILDSVADFALSYPMASSLATSANGGANGVVVTRGVGGAAASWQGRYEGFPTRLYLPGFYAEGGSGAGAILSTFLAIVSPADGNWHGNGTAAGGAAEAPGENLGTATTLLVNLGTIIFDGCEKSVDRPISGHTIMASLGTLFGTATNRSAAPTGSDWTAAKCGVVYPGIDEASNVPVGWMELPNTSVILKTSTTTTGRVRGMVGVFFETATGAAGQKVGDVARLWGDPTTLTSQSGCTFSSSSGGGPGGSTACLYSFSNLFTSQP